MKIFREEYFGYDDAGDHIFFENKRKMFARESYPIPPKVGTIISNEKYPGKIFRISMVCCIELPTVLKYQIDVEEWSDDPVYIENKRQKSQKNQKEFAEAMAMWAARSFSKMN